MGIFKNGKEIKPWGNNNKEEVQGENEAKKRGLRITKDEKGVKVTNSKGIDRYITLFSDIYSDEESEDIICDTNEEIDYESEDDNGEDEVSNIIKQFKVLHMSFVGDGSDTYKVMLLQDIGTTKRHYLEINVYDYDATDEDDAQQIDIVTLMQGDTVEI